MKTLEAKPFDQSTENWKRENRLFTSTVLEAGASGQNRIGTHSEVIEQFDSFSLLKLLFLVRNWHCWSRKAFPRQMTPQSREKLRRRSFFDRADRHETFFGRSRLYASAQGRHETVGVLLLFSSLSFDISMKNSVQRWSSDIQGLFCVKIRKMALGSNDLSTLPLSSELITFPENVVIFFAQIIIDHMLITGNKNLCGVFGWNIALGWGRKWALKRRNSRKHPCFSLLWLKARWTDA